MAVSGTTADQTSASAAQQEGQGIPTATSSATTVGTTGVDASTIALWPELQNSLIKVNDGTGPTLSLVTNLLRVMTNAEQDQPIGQGASRAVAIEVSRAAGRNASNAAVRAAAYKQLVPQLAKLGVVPPVGPEEGATSGTPTVSDIRGWQVSMQGVKELSKAGYSPSSLGTVGKLVDGAGTTGFAPATRLTNVAASQLYREFQQEYGDGSTAQARKWQADLTGAGLINPDDVAANPTQTYSHAYMSLLTEAEKGNTTAAQELTAMSQGLPSTTPTANTIAVTTIANQMGVKLTPNQVNVLATIYSNASSTTEGDDAVRGDIANMYQSPSAGESTTGWASVAQNSLQDTYAEYGLKLSPDQEEQYIRQALNQATSTYQVKDQATSLAETAAKQVAATAFPSIASQIGQGMTVSQILQPYLSSAQDLLGISGADQDITTPMWQAALHGGTDGNSLMTLTQWNQYLRSNPQYGWQDSANARDEYASVADSIGSLMGAPTPNLQTSSTLATGTPS